MFISDALDIRDPVMVFDHIMEEIEIEQYLKADRKKVGRIGYNPVDMLKTILFGFMDKGYISLRELEDECRINIRYMYLMNYERPSYHTFGNFINDFLTDNVESIFLAINEKIIEKDHVDLNHLYIDGTKFEANANKYTWVWKKATEKSRYRKFAQITELLEEMNEDLSLCGLKIDTNTEYTPESLEMIIAAFCRYYSIKPETFRYGKGHRKSVQQRQYEKLCAYKAKLEEYVEKIQVCGENRNSYSKTDHDATFMHIKKDHMRNDQLLPAYNVQIGVADEYIAVVDVMQYRSDMDCFIPLMEKFRKQYGFYPGYPVADAGYGSYNNYLYCEEHGMQKYMKFPMYRKETEETKYRENPYRVENFRRGTDGTLICPNGKKMVFSHRTAVKGNLYGRQYEIYRCEDCSNCPHAEKCKKGSGNRETKVNEELTSMHKEVLSNLNSIQGAYLRMNRSIQAEGTFGVMKQDREYRRTVRRSIKKVKLEIYLVSVGYNLQKYYRKQQRLRKELNEVC